MMFVNNLVSKMPLVIQRHAPQICVGVGIVTGIGATVMAAKSGIKAKQIVKEYKKTKDEIEKAKKISKKDKKVDYTEEDYQKDVRTNAIHSFGKVVKVFLPSVLLTGMSITFTLTGFGILNSRYIAATTAFAMSEKAFRTYRENLKKYFKEDGEDIDQELMAGTFKYEEKKFVKDENGEVKEVVEVKKASPVSTHFVRVFNAKNCGASFSNDPEENKIHLEKMQDYFNDHLDGQGYVLLNEVLEMLGFKKTKMGYTYGWLKNKNDKNDKTYISFGLEDSYHNIDFINGDRAEVVLTFNCKDNVMHSEYFDDIAMDDDKEALDELYADINK